MWFTPLACGTHEGLQAVKNIREAAVMKDLNSFIAIPLRANVHVPKQVACDKARGKHDHFEGI